ncbi:uncharacterized protein BDW43DRAFT_312012 [Aspergillus alliaceus]|uniref:uncharacterized protein n=1 Tax=Petromyces alliaceus TaxID=209559 RepID=UPI0012A5B632|nr:uncharacterized protein BDW43DRAFT_312012 [Aspergillus alliaceus]KAB8232628.1 hypothetical protein BDW43DRAFT_312012 [Aspergillus alliaceus]
MPRKKDEMPWWTALPSLFATELRGRMYLSQTWVVVLLQHVIKQGRATPIAAKLYEADGHQQLFLKDESERFGTSLASFKALGAPYAIYKLLVDEIFSQIGVLPTSCELRTDKYRYITQSVTIFGCRFIDYIHNHVSVGRASWMKGLGLAVIHANGKYEASVERAKADARMNGWHFVSSTSWSDFDSGIPQDVMNAYVAVVEEALNRLPAVNEITHVSSAAVLEALLQQFSLGSSCGFKSYRRTGNAYQ